MAGYVYAKVSQTKRGWSKYSIRATSVLPGTRGGWDTYKWKAQASKVAANRCRVAYRRAVAQQIEAEHARQERDRQLERLVGVVRLEAAHGVQLLSQRGEVLTDHRLGAGGSKRYIIHMHMYVYGGLKLKPQGRVAGGIRNVRVRNRTWDTSPSFGASGAFLDMAFIILCAAA